MQLFRDHVLKSPTGSNDPNVVTVLGVVVNTMQDHIQMERDGDSVDKSMLKACTYMLESLYIDKTETDDQRLYNVCFEPRYLDASREFYKRESEQLLRDSDAGAYCRQARRRLIEEQDRCRSTVSETTTTKIETVVLEELIQNKIKELIEMDTGVKFMIDNDRIDELGLIYDLNARVDDKKVELTKAIQKQIINLGNEVNNAALSPPAKDVSATNQQTIAAIKWVEEILDLKDRFDRFWKTAFQSDQVLQTAMTRSFTDFINSSIFTRGAEYLSLFIDDNMKKGIKDKTDTEIDAVLDKAITLLRYVQEKDMFERYYKKHLARRLLMSKSISMDVEKQMIGKMKIELGNSFTTKLEAMFKDMTISEELTTAFKAHMTSVRDSGESELIKGIDLSINVLTSMTWPLDSVGNTNDDDSQARRTVIYPPGIQKVIDRFKLFYSKKHNGRMLTWQPGMGTADIKARFPKLPGREGSKERIHELNVSTYAMIVLSLFNDLQPGESLTFTEIQALTNIPAHDLVRNLQALSVAPKTRVLRKEPMSREVGEKDKFYFNETFTTKFLRVKVGVVASGNRVETERERMKTEKKNEESRNFVCEAAIVRIMKYVPCPFLLCDRVKANIVRQTTKDLTSCSACWRNPPAAYSLQARSCNDQESNRKLDRTRILGA
jgi:cullin 3